MKKGLEILIVMLVLVSSLQAQVTSTWFRVDADYLGTKFWIAGSNDVGGHLLVHDFLVYPGWDDFTTNVGFDIGFMQINTETGFTFAELIGADWNTANGDINYIVPQVYVFYDKGSWYAENWFMYNHEILNRPDNLDSFIYERNFIRYRLLGTWGIGPHLEYVYDVPNSEMISLQYGLIIGGSYGKTFTIEIYNGIDIKNDNESVGRFTLVHFF